MKANVDRLVLQSEKVTLPPYVVATFYARLGQPDEAMKWLEKGYEERDFRLIMITVSFEFDSIRTDPRFRELVRRMGLPE